MNHTLPYHNSSSPRINDYRKLQDRGGVEESEVAAEDELEDNDISKDDIEGGLQHDGENLHPTIPDNSKVEKHYRQGINVACYLRY